MYLSVHPSICQLTGNLLISSTYKLNDSYPIVLTVHLNDMLKCKVLFLSTAQSSEKMLTGGILSDSDLRAQYQSGSDSFKSFIVDPQSTTDSTDRYLKNRWQIVFIALISRIVYKEVEAGCVCCFCK